MNQPDSNARPKSRRYIKLDNYYISVTIFGSNFIPNKELRNSLNTLLLKEYKDKFIESEEPLVDDLFEIKLLCEKSTSYFFISSIKCIQINILSTKSNQNVLFYHKLDTGLSDEAGMIKIIRKCIVDITNVRAEEKKREEKKREEKEREEKEREEKKREEKEREEKKREEKEREEKKHEEKKREEKEREEKEREEKEREEKKREEKEREEKERLTSGIPLSQFESKNNPQHNIQMSDDPVVDQLRKDNKWMKNSIYWILFLLMVILVIVVLFQLYIKYNP